MSEIIRLTTPLTVSDTEPLHIGQKALLNGVIYTGRDAAHKRLMDLINKNEPLPFDIEGQIIYYVGPAPAETRKAHRIRGADHQLPDGHLRPEAAGTRPQRNDRKGQARSGS